MDHTAADFISRPGQPIQKFRKDDIIVGGTNLGGKGGGGGNVEHITSSNINSNRTRWRCNYGWR